MSHLITTLFYEQKYIISINIKRLNESVNIYKKEAKIKTERNGIRRFCWFSFDDDVDRRPAALIPVFPKLNAIPPGPKPDERNTTLGPLPVRMPRTPPCPILLNISAISPLAKNCLNNSSAQGFF